jgi:hypothetical protein
LVAPFAGIPFGARVGEMVPLILGRIITYCRALEK